MTRKTPSHPCTLGIKVDQGPLFNIGSPLSWSAGLTASPTLINFISLSFCLMSGNSFPTHGQTTTFKLFHSCDVNLFYIHRISMSLLLYHYYYFGEDFFKNILKRTYLVVQWLRLCASTAGFMGSVPGWGIKILHAVKCGTPSKKRC